MSGDDEFTRDPLVRAAGEVIRAHREAAGLSRIELAQTLGCTPQWIEALEAGRKPLSEPTADDLDTFFKTPGRLFWTLWTEIKKEGKHRAQLPGFEGFVEQEASAVSIDCFAPQAIPGLLQTEAYARAVMDTNKPADQREVLVKERMDRQGILGRPMPPRAWFVIEEAVLHRPVGGSQVMREQLKRLLDLASAIQNIQVRILPLASVTWASLDGSFIILGFADSSQTAYFESPDRGSLINIPPRVTAAAVRFSLVMGEALPASASRKLIHKALEDYS
ncbi:hypothetical protein BTM25_26790 [Actinomadura rubteroloni]|uniref:HTH cro/C1-type domain-containing protein n=1 Tax=Actinomadura rubteroloni TaxID=1926885 RepID=A0A2P4UG56_9ACTN|nr:helix-turn-helix transcriptional regulator [Actinomadura rubteroloni]POM24052.1 hypothetical protein BTM25_26790 [Actinomadura rubteroloni]